ncbi:hypothetical protein Tco_0404421 [Tanacetum coccineum]
MSRTLGVKLHDVPIKAFSEDGLIAIATKLGTPLMLDSYTSNTKNPRQAVKGVQVGMNMGLKLTKQVYQPVSKKNGASGSGIQKLPEKGANSNVGYSTQGTPSEAFGSPNTTPLAEKIYNLERQMWYRKLVVVDDDGKPINKVDSLVNANSDSKVDEIVGTMEGNKVDDDDDPYDDNVYDSHDVSKNL